MNKLIEFKKKNYICLVNIRNLNNHLKYYFKIIREKILNTLTSKIERQFV